MKNKGVTILLIITNIILIAILCSFIRINGSIIKEKQIVKEMSETAQVTDLNNQINALNTEHTEYMNYTQTCKAQLASAITDMGIETSENASLDTMANNIRRLSNAKLFYVGSNSTTLNLPEEVLNMGVEKYSTAQVLVCATSLYGFGVGTEGVGCSNSSSIIGKISGTQVIVSGTSLSYYRAGTHGDSDSGNCNIKFDVYVYL